MSKLTYVRSIAGWRESNILQRHEKCESNILQRHEKCQFYAFRDVATDADRAEYFMAPNLPRKPFRFKPNPFLF